MDQTVMIRTDELTTQKLGRMLYGDPTTRFSESMHSSAVSLENRTSEELARDGRTHEDPVLREHALFQLLAREGAASLPVLREALQQDTDTDLRINILWALEWLGSEECRELGLSYMDDSDHRVREWARVIAWEMGWTENDFRVPREFKHYKGRTFDETIYLHIMANLYIRLDAGNKMWGHMLLSPQVLARVYGQAMACPIFKTREDQIVIAKTLKGLHADGTDHHETFLFKGFTDRTASNQGNFYFETQTKRPFFHTGRANDESEGVTENVNVPFAREGQWFLNDDIVVEGQKAIEYVRGLFQGWAFVNLERILGRDRDFLFPGNSILSSLHDPVAGPKTNAFLVGRFKGKVVDWNDDGIIDLNYLPAYATADGEVDSDLDGIADSPGLTMSRTPAKPETR